MLRAPHPSTSLLWARHWSASDAKSCLRWRLGHRKVNDLFPVTKLGLQPVLPVPSCEDRKGTAQSFHLANTTDLVSWQRLVQVPTKHCQGFSLADTGSYPMSNAHSQADGHITAPAVFVSIMQHMLLKRTQPFAPRTECQGREEASCDWHHSHRLPPRTGTQTNLLFPGLPALPVLQLSIQIPGNCETEDWLISGCPDVFSPLLPFSDVTWFSDSLWKHGNLAPSLCTTLFTWPIKKTLESGSRICSKWLRCDAKD